MTSVLGFWRVKRWERSILASQEPAPSSPSPAPGTSAPSLTTRLQRALGLHDGRWRAGLGFPTAGGNGSDADADAAGLYAAEVEYGEAAGAETSMYGGAAEFYGITSGSGAGGGARAQFAGEAGPGRYVLPADADPERAAQIAQALANDARLQQELRQAGFM